MELKKSPTLVDGFRFVPGDVLVAVDLRKTALVLGSVVRESAVQPFDTAVRYLETRVVLLVTGPTVIEQTPAWDRSPTTRTWTPSHEKPVPHHRR